MVKKEDIVADFADSLFETEAMKLARTDLILVGIVGIVDPPREEIPYVVSTLRGAGIRFFMVSIIAGLCAIY